MLQNEVVDIVSLLAYDNRPTDWPYILRIPKGVISIQHMDNLKANENLPKLRFGRL